MAFEKQGAKLVLCPTRAQAEAIEQHQQDAKIEDVLLALTPVVPLPDQPTEQTSITAKQIEGLSDLPKASVNRQLTKMANRGAVHRRKLSSGAAAPYYYWRTE
jgi:Fic family protein